MRLYRNMQSRIEGVQKRHFHLYEGKALSIGRDQFYVWALNSEKFHQLFEAWEESGYDRKLTPSVDRLDSGKGYMFGNIEWITHSENSSRGSRNPARVKLDEAKVREIRQSNEKSRVLAVRYGVSPDHISRIRNGKSWAWVA